MPSYVVTRFTTAVRYAARTTSQTRYPASLWQLRNFGKSTESITAIAEQIRDAEHIVFYRRRRINRERILTYWHALTGLSENFNAL